MDSITSTLAILLITSLATNIFLFCVAEGYRKTCSLYREACEHYEAYIASLRLITTNPSQIARIDKPIKAEPTFLNEDNGVSE